MIEDTKPIDILDQLSGAALIENIRHQDRHDEAQEAQGQGQNRNPEELRGN